MSIPTYSSYADYKNNWQPYDSPVETSTPLELQRQSTAPERESPIALFAAFCLIFGYLATNVMLIDDIYSGKVGPGGTIGRSPFIMLSLSRTELTWLYVAGSLMTIACTVLVACKKMPSYGGGILLMCPFVLLISFAGSVLRESGFLAKYFACAYLFGGVCLTGTAALYFLNTPAPLSTFSPDPMLRSMSLQGGAALVIISILALRKAQQSD